MRRMAAAIGWLIVTTRARATKGTIVVDMAIDAHAPVVQAQERTASVSIWRSSRVGPFHGGRVPVHRGRAAVGHVTADTTHAGGGVAIPKDGVARVCAAATTGRYVAGMALAAPRGQRRVARAISLTDVIVGGVGHCIGLGDLVGDRDGDARSRISGDGSEDVIVAAAVRIVARNAR